MTREQIREIYKKVESNEDLTDDEYLAYLMYNSPDEPWYS